MPIEFSASPSLAASYNRHRESKPAPEPNSVTTARYTSVSPHTISRTGSPLDRLPIETEAQPKRSAAVRAK